MAIFEHGLRLKRLDTWGKVVNGLNIEDKEDAKIGELLLSKIDEKYSDEFDTQSRRMLVGVKALSETEHGAFLARQEIPEQEVKEKLVTARSAIGQNAAISNSAMNKRQKEALKKMELQRTMRTEVTADIEKQLDDRRTEQSEGLTEEFNMVTGAKEVFEGFEDMNKVSLSFSREWKRKKNSSGRAKLLSDSGTKLVHDVEVAMDEITKWDMKQFEYKNDEEFVQKYAKNLELFRKAQVLSDAIDFKQKLENNLMGGVNKSLGEVRGVLSVILDMKKDYETRFAMMNTSYYALLSEGDLKELKGEKLDQRIREAEKAGNAELLTFLGSYKMLTQKGAIGQGTDLVRLASQRSEREMKKYADDYDKRLDLLKKEVGVTGKCDAEDEQLKQKVDSFVDAIEVEEADVFDKKTRINYIGLIEGFIYDKMQNYLCSCVEMYREKESVFAQKGLKDEVAEVIENIRKIREASYKKSELSRKITDIAGQFTVDFKSVNPYMKDSEGNGLASLLRRSAEKLTDEVGNLCTGVSKAQIQTARKDASPDQPETNAVGQKKRKRLFNIPKYNEESLIGQIVKLNKLFEAAGLHTYEYEKTEEMAVGTGLKEMESLEKKTSGLTEYEKGVKPVVISAAGEEFRLIPFLTTVSDIDFSLIKEEKKEELKELLKQDQEIQTKLLGYITLTNVGALNDKVPRSSVVERQSILESQYLEIEEKIAKLIGK